MAEIFSLVIGSLALPQVALQAQALFESRQQKERQVELTQDKLRYFEGLVESIEQGISDGSMSEDLTEALLRGRIVVHQLNDSIEQWLSDCERRFKWSHYRRRSKCLKIITTLGDKLDLAQQRVRDAVPLQNNCEIREMKVAATRLETNIELMTEMSVTIRSRNVEITAGDETNNLEVSQEAISALAERSVETYTEPISVLES